MKKFSTRVLARSAALTTALAGAAVAPTAGPGVATLIASLAGWTALAHPSGAFAQATATPPLEIAKDAPDKYVVVKGDTLWDISGRFLEKPWRWPEIWELNREQIHDPHWIYPGDIVYLDRNAEGGPRLRLGRPIGEGGSGGGALGAQARLQPMTRSEPLGRNAIPTINAAAIDAFLNRPLIVDETSLANNPYLVGTEEGRLYLSRGDLAYARGLGDQPAEEWHIYRPSKPLLDPDTRKPIALEALYIGSARLEKNGDPATLRITGTTEEIGTGDRLMPAERSRTINYAPHAPDGPVDGRIVSVYRGVAQAGRNSVVALNVGQAQGIEIGHVLSISKRGQIVPDRDGPVRGQMVKLPDEAIGYLMVFRVFDHVSYGLILDASKSVAIGDNVNTP
ncbi:MAG: LysM peptidoglycan-binding domain-containing protein [Burkholderiaceae bacterium]